MSSSTTNPPSSTSEEVRTSSNTASASTSASSSNPEPTHAQSSNSDATTTLQQHDSSEVEGESEGKVETKMKARCDSCAKESASLKECIKCHSVTYCSRECQKADFKTHKKVCAGKAQEYAKNADLKMEAPRREPKAGFRGGLQKWQFDT